MNELCDLNSLHLFVAQTPAFGEALMRVWQTILPLGMVENQAIQSAVVLRYPRSVEVFNPAMAEWIVLLNSSSMPIP